MTVRDLIHKYMKQFVANRTDQTFNRMKLWFESERFAAFSYVTGLDSDKINFLPSSNLTSRYDEHLKALKTIAGRSHKVESQSLKTRSN